MRDLPAPTVSCFRVGVMALALLLAVGCSDDEGSTAATTTTTAGADDSSEAWVATVREAESALIDASLDVADAGLADLDAAPGTPSAIPEACAEAVEAVEPLRVAAADAPDEELSALIDEAADAYDAAFSMCADAEGFDPLAFNQATIEAGEAIQAYQADLTQLTEDQAG